MVRKYDNDYYLKSKMDTFNELSHSSTINRISKDVIKDINIRILKPHLITQYKLDDDFIFMDRLRTDIQNTLKLQEETTKSMMSLVLNNNMDNKLVTFHENLGLDYNQLTIDLDNINKIANNIGQTNRSFI